MTKGGYQFFDRLATPQYESLKASIREHGVLVPIIVDENGSVLDGHHRRRAAAELHVDCPSIVQAGLSEDEKEAFVITTNALRRQLKPEERAKAIDRLKILGWSSRRIAEAVGVHHTTVLRSGGADAPPDDPAPAPSTHTDVEPAAEGNGGGSPASPPTPAPRPRRKVTGKDGKEYDAEKETPELTDAEQFWRVVDAEISRANAGLLTLNAERINAVTPPEQRDTVAIFCRAVRQWADDVQTAISTKPNLKAVRDATGT